MTVKNIPFARILRPSWDGRDGDSEVSYQAMNLPPASKSLAVTNCGVLAGSPVSRTLNAKTTCVEIGDLSMPVVLNWHKSFEGNSDIFGTCADTFAETLAADNFDLLVIGGQQPVFHGIPDGAISYTYDNVGAAGTPIIIER